jgi:hypothetical protein
MVGHWICHIILYRRLVKMQRADSTLVAIAAITILAAFFGCGGGSSTSPDTVGFTQESLAGTWERPNGTRYTLDAAGTVTNVEGGPSQILDFSGSIAVVDSGGRVSGTVNLTHIHPGSQTPHSHPINFSGSFSSPSAIQMNWSVPGADNGSEIWTKVV